MTTRRAARALIALFSVAVLTLAATVALTTTPTERRCAVVASQTLDRTHPAASTTPITEVCS